MFGVECSHLAFPSLIVLLLTVPIEGPTKVPTEFTDEEILQAYELRDGGEYKKALPLYDSIVDKYPTESQFLIDRGKCHWNLNKLDAAIRDFERALQLRPSAENRYLLAQTQFHSEKFSEALATCKQALQDEPTEEEMHNITKLTNESIARMSEQKLTSQHVGIELQTKQESDEEQDENPGDESSIESYMQTEYKMEKEDEPEKPISEAIYLEGNELYNQRDYKRALLCYDSAIHTNPTVSRYYGQRGLCLSRLGKMNTALRDWKKALELEPYNVKCRLLLARALLDVMGEVQEAVENLDEALKEENIDPRAKEIAMAMKKRALGMDEESIETEDYSSGVEMETSSGDEFMDRMCDIAEDEDAADDDETRVSLKNALKLFSADKYYEAIEVMDKAIEKNKHEPKLYLQRGIMLWVVQDLELAIANYEQALELDPNDTKCRLHLAQAQYDSELYEAALINVQQTVFHANKFNSKDEYDQAHSLLNKLQTTHSIGQGPGEPDPWPPQPRKPSSIIIRTDGNESRHEEARERDARAKKEEDPVKISKKLNNRACRLFGTKMYESALEFITEAIEKNPDEPTYYRNRGMIFEELKHYDWAIADYQRAVDLDPRCVRSHLGLAEMLMKMEDYHKASDQLRQALNEASISPSERTHAIKLLELIQQKLDQKVASTWPQEGEQTGAQALEDEKMTEADPEKNKEASPSENILSACTSLEDRTAHELNGRGNVLFSKGDYKQALECYTRAIEEDRREPMYLRNRAACFLELSEPGLALKDIAESQSIESEASARGLFLLAQALDDSGQSNKALEFLDGALLRDDNLPDTKKLFIETLRKKIELNVEEKAAKERNRKGKQVVGKCRELTSPNGNLEGSL